MPTKSFFTAQKPPTSMRPFEKLTVGSFSTLSPYGPCIYGVMSPAPGVQSGHYLGDATAPVVKVTWYTPDVLTLMEYWRILNV